MLCTVVCAMRFRLRCGAPSAEVFAHFTLLNLLTGIIVENVVRISRETATVKVGRDTGLGAVWAA